MATKYINSITYGSDEYKLIDNTSGYTKNAGTVTSVGITDGGGLTITGSPITTSGSITVKHSNSVTAQATQAVYPIKIDANGHISAYGTAVTSMTPTSHTHGNIQNGGTLQTNDITIANGDKLVVTDSSDSNKIARTSISFDGSTTTQFLSKKGTWQSVSGGTNIYAGTSTSGTKYDNLFLEELQSSSTTNINLKLDIDLLWENSAPGSSFTEQTVSVDLSSYRFCLVIFEQKTSGADMSSGICRIGTSQIMSGINGNMCVRRQWSTSTTGVTFNGGYGASSTYGSYSASNVSLVPLQIYGIV